MGIIKRISRLINGQQFMVELRHCRMCQYPAALVYRNGELLATGHATVDMLMLDGTIQDALPGDVYDALNERLTNGDAT